jgi:hypothetical protein
MTDIEKAPEKMSLEELRKLVSSLSANFKRTVLIATTAVTVLSGFGFAKLSDIESKAREKVDASVLKSTEYFDVLINGQTRLQGNQWASAIPYFEKARALRQDDDFVLYSLMQCYANAAELDAGLRLIEDTEKSGLFNRNTNQVWTLLNAGRIYFLASLDRPELASKATYYIDRAERAARLEKGGEMSYVLYTRAILEYSKDIKGDWASNLTRLIAIDPRAKDWPSDDRSDAWFQLLMRKHPKIYDDFERTLRVAPAA